MRGLGRALGQSERRGPLAVFGESEKNTIRTPSRPTIFVVLDDERYGETGMQPNHTAQGVDLAAIAASGFPISGTLREQRQVEAARPRASDRS
jgi:hypothetical protein